MKPETQSEKLMKGFVALVTIVLLPFTAMWFGFVFAKLWAWFAVAAFGAPRLSIAVAVGLALMIKFTTYQSDARKKGDVTTEDLVESICRSAMYPLVTLGVGFIVKQFI